MTDDPQAPAGVGPFRGQIVRAEAADEVVSPAYDAMSVERRRAFRRENPLSYLHVTRSAEDEPDAETVDSATLARRGRASLETLIDRGCFGRPAEPAFYAYRLVEGSHTQTGVVCEVAGHHMARVGRPHEATQPGRTALLAEHFRVVRAASSPVACAVRDDGRLERLLDTVTSSRPMLDLRGTDDIRQSVWRIPDGADTARLRALLSNSSLYIIDGHHRSAALEQLRAEGIELPVLAAVFPEQSLYLVGFHRLLRLDDRIDAAEFLRRVARRFPIEETTALFTVAAGTIAMVVDGRWFRVHFDERPIRGGARIRLGSLDPVVLDREILRAIVGDGGPADITYTPDTRPFPEIVEDASAAGRIPIFVPPVSIDDMMAVADGGLIMPAKSTYFTPKVRSGLFLRRFEDQFGSG